MTDTIENVVQSNLDLLNQQEQQLMDLLDKIRQAKGLFTGAGTATTGKRRGRKRGRRGRPRGTKAAVKAGGSRTKGKRTTYLSEVVDILKKNGKMKSSDLIKAIARKRGKDYKKIQFSIYPVLTQAVKGKQLGKSKGFFEAR